MGIGKMETIIDQALFITKDDVPIAIKYLDRKTRIVTTYILEPTTIEAEKDLLDKIIQLLDQKPKQ